MNVLVVDDEEHLLDIWQNLFVMLDCEVTTASGGYEAIECLMRDEFPIVVTDVRMPEGDGFVVLDYLHTQQSNETKVFVCSGYIDDEETVLSAYTIERIIRKPFSFSIELEVFRVLLTSM